MDLEPSQQSIENLSPYEKGKGLPHGETTANVGDIDIVLPQNPWMPTHAGVELEVINKKAEPLVENNKENMSTQLLEVAKTAVVAAEVASAYSEVESPLDTNSAAWYDKPWFNLNANSDLGGDSFPNFTFQVYERTRTLGQTELKTKQEISEGIQQATEEAQAADDEELRKGILVNKQSDAWNNPYHTVPIPVDEPLNANDRVLYDESIQEKAKKALGEDFKQRVTRQLQGVKLFTDENGKNTLETTYNFKVGKGNYVVWQGGDYMLVTQDNPLVDRNDGVHLVLIYSGEQERNSDPTLDKGYSFLWRDPRRIAEMAVISAAASKIITTYGYSDNKFDRSYLHLNANWSLGDATPHEEQMKVGGYPSYAPGKWPGPGIFSPNAHPHIQIIKKDSPEQKHKFIIPFSGKIHSEDPRQRQTDNEITGLKNLLSQHLPATLSDLQGKILA